MHIYPCEITFKDTLRLLYLAQITDLYFVDVEEFTHSIAHANVIVSPNMDVFLKKVQTAFDPPPPPRGLYSSLYQEKPPYKKTPIFS